MADREIIGIVGGMGPAAGADLFNKIVQETKARSDHDHLPIVLMSYPRDIPDRSPFLLEGIGPNPADAIYNIVRDLEAAGSTVAAIPCNTAHAPAIYETVEQELLDTGAGIRLVSMIEETVRFVLDMSPVPKRVGVLSTLAVQRLGIYARPLQQAGLEVVHPSDEMQNSRVTPSIFSPDFGLKAVSPATERARSCLVEAIQHLAEKGAEVVVLGCTELPLAVPEKRIENVTIVDPTVILARRLIRITYPEVLSA